MNGQVLPESVRQWAQVPWPRLGAALAPWSGSFRARPEDFQVEEVPLYPADGSGDHVYFRVEKRGVGTHDAVRLLARELGRAPRDFGLAGLKDAQAVTRQWLSLEHVDPARLEGLALGPLRVLEVTRHRNKLRIGHLAGNRFRLKLRGTDPASDEAGRAALAELERRGVPNYFGPQRFGARGDSWQIGRALLLGDHAEACAVFAGRPGPLDTGSVRAARQLFDAGQWAEAARTWPRSFRDAARLCQGLARAKGNWRRALFAVDLQLLRLFASAYQSFLFNVLLARRIGELDRVAAGDLAWKHANGAVFLVEDAQREQPRAERFEISPTGPLYGRRMTQAQGEPGRLESEVLVQAGHRLEDFGARGALEWQGARRPLRVPLAELALERGSDETGEFLALGFRLPAGAYATCVLRQVLRGGEEGSGPDGLGRLSAEARLVP